MKIDIYLEVFKMELANRVIKDPDGFFESTEALDSKKINLLVKQLQEKKLRASSCFLPKINEVLERAKKFQRDFPDHRIDYKKLMLEHGHQ